MKHTFLIYKNTLMQADLELFSQTRNPLQNVQVVMSELFYQVTFDRLADFMEVRTNPGKEKMLRFKHMCTLHLESTTDVLIQFLATFITDSKNEEQFEMFANLWFSFLKMELNYVEQMKALSPDVQENLRRILDFITNQQIIDDEHEAIWKKSWSVIGSFFPDLQLQFEES